MDECVRQNDSLQLFTGQCKEAQSVICTDAKIKIENKNEEFWHFRVKQACTFNSEDVNKLQNFCSIALTYLSRIFWNTE